MIPYYMVLVVMTLIGSAASLFLKRATHSDGYFQMLKNINLYLGGGLYFLSALLNIFVLRHLDYSVVLPLTSITYIWTMMFSSRVLGEKIGKRKIAGVFLIVMGAVFVSI